ncbi:MAG: hypothetical protein WBE31_15875 [Candidatus Sulfotelmatobacter sp.]
MASDEQEIVKLFEDGDRALIAADLPELSRIFADDIRSIRRNRHSAH